jgi:hypothetical protein
VRETVRRKNSEQEELDASRSRLSMNKRIVLPPSTQTGDYQKKLMTIFYAAMQKLRQRIFLTLHRTG